MDKKILIVEDEPTLRSALRDKMEQVGLKIFEAANGQDGLSMAKAEKPDIILLDIVMPVMDGITMLKELRKDEWGKSAKVIFLSNLSDAENVEKALELGSNEFLLKTDWSIGDLVDKVKTKVA